MAITPVSTASATATINSGVGALAGNYETFLKLLTTQLKNQDPLSPLDTNQFTQQLTAMTGVQQQLLTNQLLTQLISQDQAGLGSAVNLIGKTVTADTAETTLSEGTATWTYGLGRAASQAKLEVLDAAGKTVWSGQADENGAGLHTFTWNGKDNAGRQLPDGGTYSLKITAVDASDKAVASAIGVNGVVTRIDTVGGQTLVTIGKSKVPLSAITSVAATS